MDIVQLSVIIVAASLVVLATVELAKLSYLRRFYQRLGMTIYRTNQTLDHLNAVLSEIEGAVQTARRIERRVVGSVDILVSQLEPPFRMLSALVAGTRAGIGSWLNAGAREHADGLDAKPLVSVAEGGRT